MLVRMDLDWSPMQVPLRIAILSDTHAYLDSNVAALIKHCAGVVHAGDIGADSVLEKIRKYAMPLAMVRGNNDIASKWPSTGAAALASLADVAQVLLPGGMLAITHGHRSKPVKQRHALLRAQFPAARAIVYGHSHRLCCDLGESPWVLNPGAAGRARTFGGPSALVLSIDAQLQWSVSEHRFARSP
jgi:uncharacterized protein